MESLLGDLTGKVIQLGDFVAVGVGKANKVKRAIIKKIEWHDVHQYDYFTYPYKIIGTSKEPIITVSTLDISKSNGNMYHSSGWKPLNRLYDSPLATSERSDFFFSVIRLGNIHDAFIADEVNYLTKCGWVKRNLTKLLK